jgi:ABC-type glutathione transport system ATPase component
MTGLADPLLQLDKVALTLRQRQGWLWGPVTETELLVDVSFTMTRGEFVYLRGDKGTGKTALARVIVQLTRPTAGTLWFDGRPLTKLRGSQLRQLRQQVQLLFQNPYTSLNPRLTVGEIVAEPLRIHRLAAAQERPQQVRQLLQQVGVNPYLVGRRPFELSGGQRQRVSLARALACQPCLLIADDPAAGLDTAVGEQLLRLLVKLQRLRRFALLLMAVDPPPAWLTADRHLSLVDGRLHGVA